MLHLRSLNHFVALAGRLHFARAAEDLGLSQSALSRSIGALEAQLGMRLFDRDRAGVTLTPQGRFAAERAALLLADAGDLERQLTSTTSAQAGHVRFGMAPMPALALLPAVMSDRLREAPDVTHDVVVRDADALWALLLAGDIEFFVTNAGFAFDTPAPRAETLGHFPISFIVRAGHPLLAGDCPGERFPVVRSSWSGLPLPPDIGQRMRGTANVIEDFGTLAAITAASDAIWFSSTYAVIEELRAGRLRELPRAEDAETRGVDVIMYSLERRSQSPWARALKQALRRRIRALAAPQGSPDSDS
jgi:DNA-binding transcriptional LysR family regulator